MLDAAQLREYVVRPALQAVPSFWTPAAEDLIMGTAAQESRLTYLDQKEASGRRPQIGPGIGLWQMEAATHADLWRWIRSRPGLGLQILVAAGVRTRDASPFEVELWHLHGNLRYACIMARALYRRRPEPLPPAGNVPAYAAYWKQHYNTPKGRGTVAQFVKNYQLVAE